MYYVALRGILGAGPSLGRDARQETREINGQGTARDSGPVEQHETPSDEAEIVAADVVVDETPGLLPGKRPLRPFQKARWGKVQPGRELPVALPREAEELSAVRPVRGHLPHA